MSLHSLQIPFHYSISAKHSDLSNQETSPSSYTVMRFPYINKWKIVYLRQRSFQSAFFYEGLLIEMDEVPMPRKEGARVMRFCAIFNMSVCKIIVETSSWFDGRWLVHQTLNRTNILLLLEGSQWPPFFTLGRCVAWRRAESKSKSSSQNYYGRYCQTRYYNEKSFAMLLWWSTFAEVS